MDRFYAGFAATALCTVWAAGCATTPTPPPAVKLTGPAAVEAATQPLPAAQPGDNDPSMSALVRNLPANLDGEIRRAQLLRSKGYYQDAAHVLSQLMLVAPDDPRVVGEFGKVMAQEGHSRNALAFLKRASELQPNDWTIYSAMGVTYDQLDDRKNARAAYEHALALKPGDATVLNNYAVSRMLAGDLDGAQRLLAQASQTGSDYPKIASNLAMLASMRNPQTAATGTAPVGVAQTPVGQAPVHMANVTVQPIAAADAGAPKQLTSPEVVMQKVPVDPEAGPVATASHAPSKLANATAASKKVKHPVATAAAKPAAPAPTLRTAAESN
jgi:Flp pilus assembly protein TadD